MTEDMDDHSADDGLPFSRPVRSLTRSFDDSDNSNDPNLTPTILSAVIPAYDEPSNHISTSTPVHANDTKGFDVSLIPEHNEISQHRKCSESTPEHSELSQQDGEFSGSSTIGSNIVSDESIGINLSSELKDSHKVTKERLPLMIPGSLRVPIVGHEIMEARAKFTIYKIQVLLEDDALGWFIFRRYTDFVNLNDQLRDLFPNMRLVLPPKRWIRNNYDAEFLKERQCGLQAFLNNVTCHRDLCNSLTVREFFCFDEPPGPYDSLEEARAQCENLETIMHGLRQELHDKTSELELASEELELYKGQVELLTSRLSEMNKHNSPDRRKSDSESLKD